MEFEITTEKARKNLKKIYNKINNVFDNGVSRALGKSEVLVVAIGGYNRTEELLIAMGAQEQDIITYSNLTLSSDFIKQTHHKKILLIKKINYVTGVVKGESFSKKRIDLNVADAFEESLMLYISAERKLGRKNEFQWVKPEIVVLDDRSLNLQYEGHRFFYFPDIGFVQMRNRNADPYKIIAEIKDVEEADRMMFSLYQDRAVDESTILDVLNVLDKSRHRELDGEYLFKPTEFKRLVGNKALVQALKEIPELGIYQLKSNKKYGQENARWIVVPTKAFEFNGFNFIDEDEQFKREIEQEEASEKELEKQMQRNIDKLLSVPLKLNFMQGVVGTTLGSDDTELDLKTFLSEVDLVDQQTTKGKELLSSATTKEEYQEIKKHHLAYFLDGRFKDNQRNDQSYLGGKRLLSIDIDEGDYQRSDIEERLGTQGLFGLVYPTARYYFNQSLRWRIILLADREMNKEEYRETIKHVGSMLDIPIDESSCKISQLMGYPLAYDDVSIVSGTMVRVRQQAPKTGIISFKTTHSTKSLLDFNHKQAELCKEALTTGFEEGRRNNDYHSCILFLRDIQNDPDYAHWKEEAQRIELELKQRMATDGLSQKEIDIICR